jgi:molecular chaperone GrpE
MNENENGPDKDAPEVEQTDEQQNAAEMAETMVLTDSDVEAHSAEYAETMVLDEGDAANAELREALEQAEDQVATYKYAMAEAENKVRRKEVEAQKMRDFAVERFAGDMLAVLDSLELGIQAAEEGANVESLLEGNKAGLKQFLAAMKSSGVEPIDPEGEPFNPEQHEAMVMQPSDTAEPGSVLTVVQRGYVLKGRLLRPARVIVAKEPD